METIDKITAPERLAEDIINDLKQKSIIIPAWSDLEKEYNPRMHPVVTDPTYLDKVTKQGIERMTRITLGLQRLSAKRMTELAFGIPVKRLYHSENKGQEDIAKVVEKILQRNRIDSRNIERGNMLFAGCEVVTLWFAIQEENTLYGVKSPIKLRCKNYSPMNGDSLYPLLDEYDDMIALSFGHSRTQGDITTEFFDTYTNKEHIQWTKQTMDTEWTQSIRETITLGKIPGIYISRPTPIWEDTSNNVYESEWSLSRNGNYLRKNSKPIVALFADQENIIDGKEKDDDSRSVFQYPKGSDLKYVTWPQATDSLKFHIDNISRWFFTELQLPDMSFESMKTTPMSGEARKMMFIDARLKTTDESGRWLEAFDREINVIKEFLKIIIPGSTNDIDSLQIENVITPYAITDDKDTIQNLSTANGGKPMISQRESVKTLGWSTDIEQTMKDLQNEAMADITQPTL